MNANAAQAMSGNSKCNSINNEIESEAELETYLLLMCALPKSCRERSSGLLSIALCLSLLSLSDSALPTGGFVASSGLESFLQHGFLQTSTGGSQSFTLLSFLRESLVSYAHLNLHFFESAHKAVWSLRRLDKPDNIAIDAIVNEIIDIDDGLEQMLLNHVTRRASKAQGIALLTLYSRAFATLPSQAAGEGAATSMTQLMDALKLAVRSKSSSMQGHLPVCFAVLCAVLGLSLGM